MDQTAIRWKQKANEKKEPNIARNFMSNRHVIRNLIFRSKQISVKIVCVTSLFHSFVIGFLCSLLSDYPYQCKFPVNEKIARPPTLYNKYGVGNKTPHQQCKCIVVRRTRTHTEPKCLQTKSYLHVTLCLHHSQTVPIMKVPYLDCAVPPTSY